MSPFQIALAVFLCTFGGAVFGMFVRSKSPDRFFAIEERESIKLSVGVIATMTALVLGLVTASAKSSFDAEEGLIKQAAAQVLTLDRLLARYGPETAPIRLTIRNLVAARVDATAWDKIARTKSDGQISRSEEIAEEIRGLRATNERQIAIKLQALTIAENLTQIRWSVVKEEVTSIPPLFIVLLVCWLTFTFASFSLLAVGNPLLVVIYASCALSVSSAVFLLLEMDSAFSGLLTVSLEPLRLALAHLN